jgi:hypothetical protein
MAKTGPKSKPFSQLKSVRHIQRRLNQRLLNVDGNAEALAIIRKLQRDFPESKGNRVTNISLLTLVKNLRLSYNQVRNERVFPLLVIMLFHFQAC